MKRKIKLSEKDLKLKIKGQKIQEKQFSKNETEIPACQTTTMGLTCYTGNETFETKCNCNTGNETLNFCTTDYLSKRDNLGCDKTYVGDCNTPVTDKSYAVACTVDGCQKTLEQCIEPGTIILSNCGPCEETDDCPISDDCGETFGCLVSFDGCEVESNLHNCESNNVLC